MEYMFIFAFILSVRLCKKNNKNDNKNNNKKIIRKIRFFFKDKVKLQVDYKYIILHM